MATNSTTSRVCVLIPTYNNGSTIATVVQRAAAQGLDVMVVNDGSTDDTAAQLDACKPTHIVTLPKNSGKGVALKRGFAEARRLGYDAVITLDGDGQHYPEDIPTLLEAHASNPRAIIVGSRDLNQKNMNASSNFANRFSNFWFTVQTSISLPDTQTGFRLYPLASLHGERLLTARYEAELLLLVLAAWAGERLIPIPVRVYYPPQSERVSHFRPTRDFARISVLNTILCLLALVYGYPRLLLTRLLHSLTPKKRDA